MRRPGRGRERPDEEAVRELLAGTDPMLSLLEQDAPPARPAWLVLDQLTGAVASDSSLWDGVDMPLVEDAQGAAGGRRPRASLASLAVRSAAAVLALGIAVVAWPSGDPSATAEDTPAMLSYELAREQSFLTADGEPAGEVLRAFADAAERREEPAKAGPVQKVRSVEWALHQDPDAGSGPGAIVPKDVLTLVREDGVAVRIERSGSGLLIDPHGKQPAPGPTQSAERIGRESIPLDDLAVDNEQRLRSQLLNREGCATAPVEMHPRCLLSAVTSMRTLGTPTKALDAATWRLLASEGAFVTLGDVTDRAGRSGVAVTTAPLPTDDARHVVVIDPVSGRLLSSELVAVTEHAGYQVEVPAVVEFMALLSATWSNDTVVLP